MSNLDLDCIIDGISDIPIEELRRETLIALINRLKQRLEIAEEE